MSFFEIELMPHNGVAGRNSVDAYKGAVIPLCPDMADAVPTQPLSIAHDGRFFTYSHNVKFDTNGFLIFRECVQGEPSDWAKERANA